MSKRATHILVLIVLSFVLKACDSNEVKSAYHSLPTDLGWKNNHFCSFDFTIKDTLPPYNIFFKLRNSKAYPYSNIHLISKLIYPSGRQLIDTLEYEMAAKNGELLGSGILLKESKLAYKAKIRLLETGNYRLQLKQAVRRLGDTASVPYLKGVTDVGFRIEKYSSH